GKMEYNKNEWIREGGASMENNFCWSCQNLELVGIFGIVIPVLVYKGIIKEFHLHDDEWGRPYTKFI
ncbi:hypothetical protein EJD97_017027, partial [Solanum chilense]